MSFRRRLLIIVLLVFLVFILVACGEDTPENTGPTTTTTTTIADASSEDTDLPAIRPFAVQLPEGEVLCVWGADVGAGGYGYGGGLSCNWEDYTPRELE